MTVEVPLPPAAEAPRPGDQGPDAVGAPARPRPGALASSWRLVSVVTWVAVVLAWSAVWSASVQLGLSTWWLGPRADPTPVPVRLAPYLGPVLVTLGALNGIRRLPWLGVAASAVFAGYGLGDLGRVPRLAAVELLIAAAAAVVSLASLTGMYRRPRR